MNATHTPGPWEFDAAGGEGLVKKQTPGLSSHISICRMYDAWICDEHGGTAEANAKLIAAAPDLLNACNAMIDWDDREHDHSNTFNERMEQCSKAFTLARQAILKATGIDRPEPGKAVST
jgi:hypothetical protein